MAAKRRVALYTGGLLLLLALAIPLIGLLALGSR